MTNVDKFVTIEVKSSEMVVPLQEQTHNALIPSLQKITPRLMSSRPGFKISLKSRNALDYDYNGQSVINDDHLIQKSGT